MGRCKLAKGEIAFDTTSSTSQTSKKKSRFKLFTQSTLSIYQKKVSGGQKYTVYVHELVPRLTSTATSSTPLIHPWTSGTSLLSATNRENQGHLHPNPPPASTKAIFHPNGKTCNEPCKRGEKEKERSFGTRGKEEKCFHEITSRLKHAQPAAHS